PPGSQPGTRPAPSLPNRSAGKLPPLAEEEVDFPPTPPVPPPIPTRSQARLPGRSPTPPVARPGKAAVAAKPVAEAQSAPLGWADEDATSPKRSFGPVGLVAVALLLMVGVYVGAMMLMK